MPTPRKAARRTGRRTARRTARRTPAAPVTDETEPLEAPAPEPASAPPPEPTPAAPDADVDAATDQRLKELGELHDQGVLTDEQFDEAKKRIIEAES